MTIFAYKNPERYDSLQTIQIDVCTLNFEKLTLRNLHFTELISWKITISGNTFAI